MAQAEKAALSCVLALGFLTGLWGIRWGLPGAARLRAFPEKLYPSAEIAQKLTEHWAKLYKDIRQSHQEMRKEEPVTYVKGREAVAPGWDFPPEPLINSYRSLLTQSANPDEKKSFIILSQMRPWKLEFKPLYAHYGGAFIYPLGLCLKMSSWIGTVNSTESSVSVVRAALPGPWAGWRSIRAGSRSTARSEFSSGLTVRGFSFAAKPRFLPLPLSRRSRLAS